MFSHARRDYGEENLWASPLFNIETHIKEFNTGDVIFLKVERNINQGDGKLRLDIMSECDNVPSEPSRIFVIVFAL
ncbi:hypothetical protein RclHR1_19110001 [Rhizophagus clarus]|uniref:Uncharacterized protein n=1 Tax=Rhizophagus clarus TaxID=94130 RepID=A0A2Z6QN50_9GLOM|nr:hypothetical protein RclHR1_19110001 [Rhizophagus clarus]